MSFLIRQISRTADGREIVRDNRVETSTLSVGRDAASDIHLADLGVSLRHAQITRIDDRHIALRPLDGARVDVDGQQSAGAEIDAARGAELRFGSHRATVSLEDGTVILRYIRRAA